MPTPEQRATTTSPSSPDLDDDIISGAPPIDNLISFTLVGAEGATAVVVCGPLGLNAAVRTQVARRNGRAQGEWAAEGVFARRGLLLVEQGDG